MTWPLWIMSSHRVTSLHVRYSPQSGRSSARFARPLSAKSGHQSELNASAHPEKSSLRNAGSFNDQQQQDWPDADRKPGGDDDDEEVGDSSSD